MAGRPSLPLVLGLGAVAARPSLPCPSDTCHGWIRDLNMSIAKRRWSFVGHGRPKDL